MRRKSKAIPDLWLIIIVLSLVSFGLVMVYSSSSVDAAITHKNDFFYVIQQGKWAILALMAMMITTYIPMKWFEFLAKPVYFVGIVLLALLLIPGVGTTIKGATRWIDLGFTTFMPSEVVKIGMVMMYAKFLSGIKGQLRNLKDIFIGLVIFLLPAGLILKQPDYSTMLIVIGTAGVMMVVAGLPWLYTGVAAALGGSGLVYLAFAEEYRRERVLSFLNPWKDPIGDGYQVIQSLYAIVSGGLTGLGFGQSRQKFGYLPEAMSDFIFAIIAEELGLMGVTLLIGLYVLFLWRGFRIAMKAKDMFSSLLATGFTTMICLQSIVNIGVATSSLPPTGITLPFISAGGTSLAISLVAVGLMLNASKSMHTKSA